MAGPGDIWSGNNHLTRNDELVKMDCGGDLWQECPTNWKILPDIIIVIYKYIYMYVINVIVIVNANVMSWCPYHIV